MAPAVKRLIHAVDLERKVKSEANTKLSALYKDLQKAGLYDGMSKTYETATEDKTDTKPPETKVVQMTVKKNMDAVRETLTDLINATFTRDNANDGVKSDVVVDDVTIFKNATQPFLLALCNKFLKDLCDEIAKIPTLPADKKWEWDSAQGLWTTDITKTRSETVQEIPTEVVKATDKFPAQVVMQKKMVLTGWWNTRHFNGAVPVSVKEELLKRARKATQAIKAATEEANAETRTTYQDVANPLMEYIFAPLK